MSRLISILLFCISIFGCAAKQTLEPGDVEFITLSESQDTNSQRYFSGVGTRILDGEDDKDIRILYAHGISCHDPNYSAAFQREIAARMGYKPHELPTTSGLNHELEKLYDVLQLSFQTQDGDLIGASSEPINDPTHPVDVNRTDEEIIVAGFPDPWDQLEQAPYFDLYRFSPDDPDTSRVDFIRQIDIESLRANDNMNEQKKRVVADIINSSEFGPYGFERCDAHRKDTENSVPAQWYNKNTIIVRRFFNSATQSWLSFYEVRWSALTESVKTDFLGFDALNPRFPATPDWQSAEEYFDTMLQIHSDLRTASEELTARDNKPESIAEIIKQFHALDRDEYLHPVSDILFDEDFIAESRNEQNALKNKNSQNQYSVNQIAQDRKLLNRIIKDELINARLADGLIYLGDGADPIQSVVVNAINMMIFDSLSPSPHWPPEIDTDVAIDPWRLGFFTGGCSFAEEIRSTTICRSVNELINRERPSLYFISESMGSKVIFDSIVRFIGQASRNANGLEVASNFVGSINTHYMYANQIPLVDIAHYEAEKVNLFDIGNTYETRLNSFAYTTSDFFSTLKVGSQSYKDCVDDNSDNESYLKKAFAAAWEDTEPDDLVDAGLADAVGMNVDEAYDYLFNVLDSEIFADFLGEYIYDHLLKAAFAPLRACQALADGLRYGLDDFVEANEDFERRILDLESTVFSCFVQADVRSALVFAPRKNDITTYTSSVKELVGELTPDIRKDIVRNPGWITPKDLDKPAAYLIWNIVAEMYEIEQMMISSSDPSVAFDLGNGQSIPAIQLYYSYLAFVHSWVSEGFSSRRRNPCALANRILNDWRLILNTKLLSLRNLDLEVEPVNIEAVGAVAAYLTLLSKLSDAATEREYGQFTIRLAENYLAIRSRERAAKTLVDRSQAKICKFLVSDELLQCQNVVSRQVENRRSLDAPSLQDLIKLLPQDGEGKPDFRWYDGETHTMFREAIATLSSRNNRYSVVSITDNNDILGYQLEQTFLNRYPFINVININRQLARKWPFFANPGVAHRAHKSDPVTQRLVLCGYPQALSTECEKMFKIDGR